MDAFKRSQQKYIGPGGIKCQCCNAFARGPNNTGSSSKLNRAARSVLKRTLRHEVNEGLIELEVEG